MDDNTKQILVLLITTAGTIAAGWLKMRTKKNGGEDDTEADQPAKHSRPSG
jgi:hypothetical protein